MDLADFNTLRSVLNVSERGGSRLVTTLFNIVLLSGVLLFGWSIRDDYLIEADYGIGYALGIVGGSAMLLLLLYPLRKRLPRSRWLLLSTPRWFRLHMMLGLVGPLCILYHCNFRLGSINSNVALGCMLLMVSSGVVGRYIYSKIHMGLYGSRAELPQLQGLKQAVISQLNAIAARGNQEFGDKIVRDLLALESDLASQAGSLGATFSVSRQCGRVKRQLQGVFKQQLKVAGGSESRDQLGVLEEFANVYLGLLRKIATLAFWDRTFSLWHMLHMPIFVMLIISGLVHVYAVHAY